MKPPVIIGLLTGLVYATTALPSEARCYSRWYYPYPQNCAASHGVYARTTRPRAVILRPVSPTPDDIPVRDIPLPDLSADWGGTLNTELELALQRQKAIRQLTPEGK